MDLLTLTVLAAHHPKQAVVDWSGDLWHARCYEDWLCDNAFHQETRLLLESRVCTDESQRGQLCYSCKALVEHSMGACT